MQNLREGLIIPIDKPYGWSSTDVVRKLKIALRKAGYPKTTKIGHAGTLDPLATGLLLICIGKATKQVNELQEQTKTYEFTVTFGATTPSFDLEHPIDQTFPYEHITSEQIQEFLQNSLGPQEQMPPLYSAKKVDGKRAYEYMRGEKPVELKTASITIYSATLLNFNPPNADLQVSCSKGTYVRSYARDIGAELNSGAHLSTLRRTANGGFTADKALSLQQAEELILQNPLPQTQI